MGTTIHVHLHDDETASVDYGAETNWPDIRVTGEHGMPITNVALLWDAAPLAVVAVGLLDNDKVQAALTPAQLTLLARIVRERAPQFSLYEAGLFKADAGGHGQHDQGGAVGGELHYAGKYILCPVCRHVGACHDKVGGVEVGCTAPGAYRDGTCGCIQVFDVATSTFGGAVGQSNVVELVNGWGFVHCSQCAVDIGAGGFVDGSRRLREHWDSEHADLLDKLSKGSSVGYVKAYNGARSVLNK